MKEIQFESYPETEKSDIRLDQSCDKVSECFEEVDMREDSDSDEDEKYEVVDC